MTRRLQSPSGEQETSERDEISRSSKCAFEVRSPSHGPKGRSHKPVNASPDNLSHPAREHPERQSGSRGPGGGAKPVGAHQAAVRLRVEALGEPAVQRRLHETR